MRDGSELATVSNEAFRKVVESASRVGELIADIAAASEEQSQGIGQVNTAVNEMDKVVQRNAASSEESASASEELSAQAEQMREMVNELADMVGGKGEPSRRDGASPEKSADGGAQGSHASRSARAVVKDRMALNRQKLCPDQVIPLDDDDLKEF